MHKVMIVAEQRDFLKQLCNYIMPKSDFLVLAVPFSPNTVERFVVWQPDVVVIDTEILIPYDVLLSQIEQNNWKCHIVLMSDLEPEHKNGISAVLGRKTLSEASFLSALLRLLGQPQQTAVCKSSSGGNLGNSFVSYPDVYSILRAYWVGPGIPRISSCHNILSPIVNPVGGMEFPADGAILIYLRRSRMHGEQSFEKCMRQISTALGTDWAVIYLENVHWREIDQAREQLQKAACISYYVAGATVELQKLSRRQDSVPFVVLKEIFSNVVDAVFRTDSVALTRNIRVLYLQTIKASMDTCTLGCARVLVCILDGLINRETDPLASLRQKLSACRTVEEECDLVTARYADYFDLLHEAALSPIVVQTLVYLFANLDMEISLEDVARKLDVNKSYLSRLFHAQTGVTFLPLLQSIRIQLAEFFLKSSQLSVQMVAAQIGYSDAHYFSRLFKKARGISPNQYRRQLKEESH